MLKLGTRRIYHAPDDDILTPLTAALKGTQHTMHGCLYVLTVPQLVDAILAAAGRGCDVAFVLDASEAAASAPPVAPPTLTIASAASFEAFQPAAFSDLAVGGSTEAVQLARLRAGGVKCEIGTSAKGSLVHSKYVVLDKKYVIWGSTNWTLSGMQRQCNQTSFESNVRLAQWFEADFQANFDRISKGGA